MTTEKTKVCKDCGTNYPETRENFGQYKNVRGGLTIIGYRNSCRHCMALRTAKHSAANPQLVKNRLARRKELEKNARGCFTFSDIQKIRKELQDECRFCGAPLNQGGEIEHLTPLSRGGTNYPRNLTLTCLNCNREKTNKTLKEYCVWRKDRKLQIRMISPSTENPDEPTIGEGQNIYKYAD
jgi:5-methylcytosine-specific restriction endonuclease McrA